MMAIVAVSKNKRTQPIFRMSPPVRPRLIIAFDHGLDLDEVFYTAEIDDLELVESVEVSELEVELIGDIAIEFDDAGIEGGVCG